MTTTINAARRYSKSRNERMLERDLDGRIYNYPGDPLWRKAGEKPSLDLRFAENKSLVDATTGANLVTFSRASGGTYVDSQGVIRNAVTNLLLRSEEFDNAYWTKSNSTIEPDSGVSPSGSLTADKWYPSSSGGIATRRILVTVTVTSGQAYTISLYVKSAGKNIAFLSAPDASSSAYNCWFDIQNGTVGTRGASVTAATIANAGNGWYRISVTSTATTTSNFFYLSAPDADNSTTVTANGTDGILVWGAQLEQSSTVGEYVPTGATINSAPRFDHNPTTGESLGLLVEEQRQNLLLRSGEFDNASWTKTGLLAFGSGSVADSTGTLAPDGTNTADLLVEDTSTGAHQLQQGVPASGTAYSYSIYAKAAGRTKLTITGGGFTAQGFTVVFNLVTGTLDQNSGGKGSITSCGNGWYRCVISFTTSSTAPFSVVFVNDSQLTGYTGDGTSGIYLWGAQLEAGAFPTSYIPTTTAAATRSADVASISGSNYSSWANASQGTMYAEGLVGLGTRNNATLFALSSGDPFSFADDHMTVRIQGTPGQARFLVSSDGVAQFDASLNDANLSRRLALAYQAGNFQAASSGVLSGTGATGIVPVVDRALIGSAPFFVQGHLCGTIRRLTYWPARLGSEVLQRITQ